MTDKSTSDADAKVQKGLRFRPPVNEDNRFFWDGLKAGELHVQRCKSCQTLRHPPGPMCPHCQSFEWDSVVCSGKGTLYSYTVMHYPEFPGYDYPNVIGLVELEEGTRLIAQLNGITREEAKIGMPLSLEINEVEPGLVLAQFAHDESR